MSTKINRKGTLDMNSPKTLALTWRKPGIKVQLFKFCKDYSRAWKPGVNAILSDESFKIGELPDPMKIDCNNRFFKTKLIKQNNTLIKLGGNQINC